MSAKLKVQKLIVEAKNPFMSFIFYNYMDFKGGPYGVHKAKVIIEAHLKFLELKLENEPYNEELIKKVLKWHELYILIMLIFKCKL